MDAGANLLISSEGPRVKIVFRRHLILQSLSLETAEYVAEVPHMCELGGLAVADIELMR